MPYFRRRAALPAPKAVWNLPGLVMALAISRLITHRSAEGLLAVIFGNALRNATTYHLGMSADAHEKLEIQLQVQAKSLGRLKSDVETAIFRIVQEALTIFSSLRSAARLHRGGRRERQRHGHCKRRRERHRRGRYPVSPGKCRGGHWRHAPARHRTRRDFTPGDPNPGTIVEVVIPSASRTSPARFRFRHRSRRPKLRPYAAFRPSSRCSSLSLSVRAILCSSAWISTFSCLISRRRRL